jgi:glyoxylase-like metal-dependent hydrolase (beta-lactamase superfamily II)
MKLDYQLLEAGFCTHCERMTLQTGQFKSVEYPALCALINHPTHGYILFDTGYSERFTELTSEFPASLYRRLTPMTLVQSLKSQLIEMNIQPSEIRYIIISHFHADHVGGLKDFPQAQFIAHPDAIHAIKQQTGFKALMHGFLPELLPNDFDERLFPLSSPSALPAHLAPFTQGFDLFSDNTCYAISLPGHSPGQIGLYFQSTRDTFLIADSCWHEETIKSLVYPSNLTYLLHHNKKTYQKTIQNLHVLYLNNKNIDLIPSHSHHARPQKRAE